MIWYMPAAFICVHTHGAHTTQHILDIKNACWMHVCNFGGHKCQH